MVEFLKKLGASKKGAAAVLGLGGLACAAAVQFEAVPHDGTEVQSAVAAVALLLAAVALVAGPKARDVVTKKLGDFFAPKQPPTGGASS